MTVAATREVDEAELGQRDKNNRARREALIEAAYALFSERGYAATTMDEIAARAGLSRRTAFRYFASKDDLVFPEQGSRQASFEALLAPREGEPAFETVKRACLALGRHYQDDRERQLAQFRVIRAEPSLVGRELAIDRALEAAIERTFLRHERDTTRTRRRARVRASAITGALRATVREWLEGGATQDLVRLGRETFAELEAGFGE
ncbi:MAG: TetR family transcriptional regulator [Sandaracinaceae bacterium]|nr:TetR family transcriptional regulator [Sandaracinaceae bacterium]